MENDYFQIRVSKRAAVFTIGAVALFASGFALSETLTMTTYYPSPSGVYRKLVSTAQTLLARDGGMVGVGTTNPQARLDVNGNSNLRGAVNTGGPIEHNSVNSGNRVSYIDFHGDDTYTDYGLRLIRWNGGANTNSDIRHRGTGSLVLSGDDGGQILLYSAGQLGLSVNSAGMVGVRTQWPWFTFDVNGSARANTLLLNSHYNEGDGCWPNGLLARKPNGAVLSCIHGVFREGSSEFAGAWYHSDWAQGRVHSANNWYRAILITAWGGNCSYCTGEAMNNCQLTGLVSGNPVQNSTNNNQTGAKTCNISFLVPPGQGWTVTSDPWDSKKGRFYYSVLHQ
jgi:hypothetical protein